MEVLYDTFLSVLSLPSGHLPNASSGEFAHQKHKKANKSSPGRDVGAHYMRHMNTKRAWHALGNGLPYNVMKYNRSTKVREEITVRPGVDCIRIVQQLLRDLPGGSSKIW